MQMKQPSCTCLLFPLTMVRSISSVAVIAIIVGQCRGFSPPTSAPSTFQQSTPSYRIQVSARSDDSVDERASVSKKTKTKNPREGSLAAATKLLGQVPYGETSRKYRRDVFRYNDWVAHRSSSSRIVNNLQSMFFSGVVRQLRPQMMAVTSVAVLVLTWNWIVTNSASLPMPILSNIELPILALPTLPFTLSSPALGLLLVFRTNAAYARWMCGRDAWSRILVHGKNLVRMSSVFSSDVDAVEDLSKAVWLYCRSVMNKLSSPDEDEEEYKVQVSRIYHDSPMARKVLSSRDRTTAAWKEVSTQLHSLSVSEPKSLLETDKSVIVLMECTSMCEQIYSSPVPLIYTRHTARCLSLWALLLPFALYSAFSSVGEFWGVLPASAIMAFFLFGVDELAMQLEEPFSILPMQTYCDELWDANKILVGKDTTSLEKDNCY